jgi:hypothetical protein
LAVVLIALPLPLAAPQVAPPVAEPQVHVTPVMVAGTVSVTIEPAEASGPALLTTIVYATGLPELIVATPSVFVMLRSALRLIVSVSVAVLFPRAESATQDGTATFAVFTSVPLAPAATVPVTV